MNAYLLPLVSAATLALVALLAIRTPGRRPQRLLLAAEAATLVALGGAIATAIRFALFGPGTSPLLGAGGIGLSARVDSVSVPMILLVAFIGWVVVRYARVYLDGEARQGVFMGWLLAALAAVLLLVQSGNLIQLALAWIVTGRCLQQLLCFYAERPRAVRAARNRLVFVRVGDIALVGAIGLLVWQFDSTDIATVLESARSATGTGVLQGTVALLAVAALLKSAQFPTHGWLTTVMEAPTPVSALLHAGVVNAGGFLLIRLADVALLSPGVLAVLVVVGGFTALFGAMVMLTQSAVKTSLAWSTIAQMGFMIMQCGLALFPLALLHIVAHSLYKAHAFLFSGAAIDGVANIRRPGPVATPSPRAVGRAFLIALLIFGVIGFAFGLDDKPPQAIALGAMLIFGVAYLIAQGLADAAPRTLTRRTALYSVGASISYFTLQIGADAFTARALPVAPAPGPLEWALLILTVTSFGLVALAQALFPLWAYHPAVGGLRVHLANGLYVHVLVERLLGHYGDPHVR